MRTPCKHGVAAFDRLNEDEGLKCPKCKLENTGGAELCDCGYDFSTGTMKESFVMLHDAMTKSNIVLGIFWAILFAFPLAAVCALIFRFPVPFSGYESGVSAVPRALGAVALYGVVGGFVVLAFVGAISGVLANMLSASKPENAPRLTLILAAAGSAMAVILMAVLDKIIGPW